MKSSWLTRRALVSTAGSLPLAFQGAARKAGAFQLPGANRADTQTEPLPVSFGAPPSLPDKLAFLSLKGAYLNSAATHPKLVGAVDLARKAAARESGETGGFRPDQRRILAQFARLINADPTEIAFVPSTQIGESFITAALGLPEKGTHVVSDELHFCGSQMMYTDMKQRGLEVTWVHMTKDGRIPLDDFDQAIIKGKTRLVAISSTSFVNGFQHDVRRVSEIAHAKGAVVFADIIQSAGNAPVDVKEWGVDAACCATYKWLMSGGTAFLYVNRKSQERMRAPFYHWSQFTTLPTTHMYPFDTPAGEIVDSYRAKPGAAGMFSMAYEPNVATLAGLEYSLPYIMNIGVARIQEHVQPLVIRLKQELSKRGHTVLTPIDARSPIVTVAAERAERFAPAFRAANVTVTTRWNHIRVAASVFNDMYDMDRFLAVMPKPA
jgi:selenocysteine lyase/cysteine desulfurase